MSIVINALIIGKRVAVVAALVEGNSINGTCRMTGVAKYTVLKLLNERLRRCLR